MIVFSYIQKALYQSRGFTLLFMMVLLAGILSISLGIIAILFGQITIIGQAGESFKAFYALDTGIERTLYRDRVQNVCTTPGNCNETINLTDGRCYQVEVLIGPSVACSGPVTRCINVTGQNICPGGQRFVQRKFSIQY